MQKLTTLCMLFFYFTVNAQIEVGNKAISGSLNFRFPTQGMVTTSNADLGLSVSKSYKKNKLTGIGLSNSYSYYLNTNNIFIGSDSIIGEVKSKNNQYVTNLSIYNRKYFPLINKLHFFLQGNAILVWDKRKTNVETFFYSTQQIQKTNYANNTIGTSLTLSPGFSYNINNHLQLLSSISNFININYNYDITNKTSGNINISSSTSSFSDFFNIGIMYIF